MSDRPAAKDGAWDLEIKPRGPWWRIELGELWRYRDLTLLLLKRDLTVQYKQSVLGPLWLVLQPLLTTLTYTVMFGLIARISPPGIPPLLFYLTGIIPWTCFANILNRTSRSLAGNSALFTKVYFPRLVMPVSITLATVVTFLVQLALMFAIIIFYHATGRYAWRPQPELLALPLVIVLITALGMGCGILVSALTTKYRDLSFLVTFGTQLLMFASPVIIPLEMAAGHPVLHAVIRANPMTPVIQAMRATLFGQPLPWIDLAWSAGTILLIGAVGLLLFQRVERSFTDIV